MNRNPGVLGWTVAMVLAAGGALAHDKAAGWKEHTSTDIKVAWRITSAGGGLRIEDHAETTAKARVKDAVAVLLDIPGHGGFMGNKCRVLEQLPDNTWLVYAFIENPWPIPDADRVSRLRYTRDEATGTAVFRFTAEPDAYPRQGVARQTHFDLTYTVVDLGNGRIELREDGVAEPPFDVPRWMVNSAFPKVPLESMRKLVGMIEKRALAHGEHPAARNGG